MAAPFVVDAEGVCCCEDTILGPRGVQLSVFDIQVEGLCWYVRVELSCSFEGLVRGVLAFDGERPDTPFVGEVDGVLGRSGDGEAGDSGRRKGEARGEPKERGEGLYGGRSCGKVLINTGEKLKT